MPTHIRRGGGGHATQSSYSEPEAQAPVNRGHHAIDRSTLDRSQSHLPCLNCREALRRPNRELRLRGHRDGLAVPQRPRVPRRHGQDRAGRERGHAAPGCLALRYSFAGGGNYVQAGCDLPKGNDARAVRLWLKKAGGNEIGFRAVDSTGQTFQKTVRL